MLTYYLNYPFTVYRGQKLLPVFGAIFVLVLFAQCHRAEEPAFPKEIADYMHWPRPYPLFYHADALKYDLDYQASADSFDAILHSGHLKARELVYCLNQLTYLNLCMNRDSVAAVWMTRTEDIIRAHGGLGQLEPGAQGDYWYNKGVLGYHLFKEPTKVLNFLEIALKIYQYAGVYPKQHLKSYQALNMLSMAHFDFDRLTDSCFEPAKTARLYLNNREFQKYKKENLLALSYMQLADRNHVNGIASCEEACRLATESKYIDTVFWIRALSQLGQMTKKSAEIETDPALKSILVGRARNILEKAVKLANIVKSPLAQEAYTNTAVFYSFFGSEMEFENILKNIDTIVLKQGRRYAYPERLRAYHELTKIPKKIEKPDEAKLREVIVDYQAILKKYINDSLCHRSILQEAFMSLARSYRTLKEYDKAIMILQEAIPYGTKSSRNVPIPLSDILHSELLKKGRSKFIYYGMIANNLLSKYKADKKDCRSLSQSFDFFNTTDSLFFSGIYSPDPDAVMTFYNEVSEEESLFSNGIYAAYDLYNGPAKNEKYIDAAFRFFEHKKSFLLYRDMVERNPRSIPNAIRDSLFVLGQKVNQLKWLRNKENSRGTTSYNTQLDSLSKKLELLYGDIKKNDSTYYLAKVTPRIPTISEIKANLHEDQALVQYGLDSKNLFLLYIEKNNLRFNKIEIDSNFYTNINIVTNFLWTNKNKRLTTKESPVINAIEFLHKKLIQPFKKILRCNVELIVIPDKQLYNIPFEILRPDSKSPFLIENIFVTYAPSWRIYQLNIKIEPRDLTSNISVIGYGDASTPGANRVHDTLQIIYPDKFTEYIGRRCSKAAITDPNNQSWLWQLSVHGQSNLSNRYDNYLNFRQDTLYGFDLFNLPHIPRLLILFSCNTAKGKMVAGEGNFTLSRAFIQAGVPHVISALWEVDDAVAGNILSDFHRIFSSGKSISRSLGLAKRKYIQKDAPFEGLDWAPLIYLI